MEKRFDTLNKSEIKKAVAFAKNFFGMNTYVSAWSTADQTEYDKETGFKPIDCELTEITDSDYNTSVVSVRMNVCLWDRRRSYVAY